VKIEASIKNIVDNVFARKGLTLDSVFLFGSMARSDSGEESDYDILIISKEELSSKEKMNLAIEISKALHEEIKSTPFDIIIKSKRDFDEEKDIVNTLSNEVILEGIKL